MQELKVVASTRIWESKGATPDFPMWQPVGSNEYVIGYLSLKDGEEPKISDVGVMIKNLSHILEGRVTPKVVEIYTGFDIYHKDNLTHNEQFQLNQGDQIDFPAEDITELKGED
jgi:hypothetical protein